MFQFSHRFTFLSTFRL